MTNRTVFLDRDGVINAEVGYISRPDELQILPGVLEAISDLTQAGWKIIVFTNQSGVGRGLITESELQAVHDRLLDLVAAAGGQLTAVYACPHAPDDGCDCRKPKPGLLLRAAREHNIDLATSYAVGDSPRDISAAHAAGCKTVLVLTGHTTEYAATTFPDPQPDLVFHDLLEFTNWSLTVPI